jgi:tetratricopeptide (TPR) repeat protein
VKILLSLLIVLAQAASSLECHDIGALIARVDRHFEAGNLQVAISDADHGLSCPNASVDERVNLYIRLSLIHDRTGLHTNSRPVEAALRSIDSASELAERASPASRAAIDLARARYYYRSEAPESDYPVSRRFARAALAQFEELDHLHGQADVVHLTGLFHLQRRELDAAQAYFDRSLELEIRSGTARPVMLADFERHTGFVEQLSGELGRAIERFERSFVIRRDNGLTDQAMFAAASLGRTLVADHRAEEAEAPLKYALDVAAEIDSPEGRARAGLAAGQMHEQLGDRAAAIEAYEAALGAARQINRTTIMERAGASLNRLRESR